MENQMSMHVIYVGEEDEVMFRDVIFPKAESVDLTDNPKLFDKLSKLPYFMVVSLLTDEDLAAMEADKNLYGMAHLMEPVTDEDMVVETDNEPVDPPVAPVEAPRRGRPRKVV